ncbi:MAG TPA: DUF1146 domain-containing protein [Erysipelothrix sp.]
MHDIVRIFIYLVSFVISAYALSGIDFTKNMRQNADTKMQILYILLSLALGYGVAQFVMGISRYSVI